MFGLYIGSSGNLFIDSNGSVRDTGLTFTPKVWHAVGLSFREESSTSDIGEIFEGETPTKTKHYLNVRVFLDDKSFNYSFRIPSRSFVHTLMVGRQFERADSAETKPFVGLMESLAIGHKYISASEFASIASKLDCVTKAKKYDEFGMYKGSEIHKSGASILSSNIEYKSLDKTEEGKSFKQLSHVVSEERISAGGEALTTRTYTTDKLGRVTGIADGKFGNHSYEYDCRGFLVKDGDTAYEYDANGNVTKIGDTVLQYDSVVKDKLVKVGDKVVTYDASNPLVPTSYDGNTYTFEGRRLVRIQKGGKVIDYTYNDQGLRIKKTVTENGTSLETRFFYDGTKLIAEITPERRMDFLYDENDRLYGFVLDKTATYFYVRDTLENILGVIDSAGNLVVQYAYNAWGKIQSITGTLATTVGEINPFRYKGYHFDSDTGMYYCHTRYYVPEWCRWLFADHVAFVRPDNVQQMNLFTYCINDPINRLDLTGNFAISVSTAIALVLAAILAAITVTAIVQVEQETHAISNAVKDGYSFIRGLTESIKKSINQLVDSLAEKNHYDSKERHHIVARADPRAMLSRLILWASGIGINDDINLVDVKKGYHRVLHTNEYYVILNSSMLIAYASGRREGVKELLEYYRFVLGGLN